MSSQIRTSIDGLRSKPEKERRFLLLSYDGSILHGRPYNEIEQGYFAPEIDSRIRIVNGVRAEFTRKAGIGEVRDELDCPNDARGARFLLESTPYRFVKHRFSVDHWDFDEFQGVAAGIPIIEFEEKDGRVFDGTKPSWVNEWLEVTNSLTSRDIAFDIPALSVRDPNVPILDYIKPLTVVRIALTSGPAGGKDGVIEHLKGVLGDKVKFVDEVASTIHRATGVHPAIPDPVHNLRFQRSVYAVQHHFEMMAAADAARNGQLAVVFNRGQVDNADYVPGGPTNFPLVSGRTHQDEYHRYHVVMRLSTPPAHIYDAVRFNNTARSEDHPQAAARDERNRTLWEDHPQVIEFGTSEKFIDKCELVEMAIRAQIGL